MEIIKKGGDNVKKEEPTVYSVALKDISTDGEKVTIKSRELVAVVKAEKQARTKNVQVVMVPGDPTPEPVPWKIHKQMTKK